MKKLCIILLFCARQNVMHAMYRPARPHVAAARIMKAAMRPYSSMRRPLGPLEQIKQYRNTALQEKNEALKAVKEWERVMPDCAAHGCSKNCKANKECMSQHAQYLKVFHAAHYSHFYWAQKADTLKKSMQE